MHMAQQHNVRKRALEHLVMGNFSFINEIIEKHFIHWVKLIELISIMVTVDANATTMFTIDP